MSRDKRHRPGPFLRCKNMFVPPGTGGLASMMQQMQATAANPPTPLAPAPMPDPQGPQALAAARLAAANAIGRGGRQSTILTSPQNSGVNMNFASKTLGGGR